MSADLLRKLPPQNLEAERAVLGGVFLSNSIFHTLVDILSEDDFYAPAHQIIYRTFTELYRETQPIDLVTTAEKLKHGTELDAVGGAAYLAELAQSVVSAANAEFHARIVREKAIQRALIQTSTEIIASCYDNSQPVDKLLDESESAIFALSEQTTGSNFAHAKQLVAQVFEELEKRVGRQELVTGVPTGYHRLNELTAGFQPSDLIIFAARPSMGKTAFALNVGLKAAVLHDIPVAIFSLEMSDEQLIQRLLCVQGRVDLRNLRRGYLEDSDWTRLYDAADVLSQAPIFIDDTPALATLELRARCRRLKAERGIGLIIVDYLQLMRTSRKTDSREQEISDISRSLKALAKELHVPVIALSQLNRKVEERTNKRPVLSDLRESGAIEQDADVIMFLYRDAVYNKKDDNPKKNIAEIIIGKQRNGPTGDVELHFFGPSTAFDDLDYTHTPPPSEDAGE